LNPLSENPEALPQPASIAPTGEVLGAAAGTVPAAPSDPAWNGWDVLRILLMTVVILVVTLVALVGLAPGATLRARSIYLTARPELSVIGQMAAELVLLGYMYIFVTRERRQPRFWVALRWNWPTRIWGLVCVGVLMQATFLVVGRFLPFPKKTPFEALLQRPSSLILIMVFSVTLGPLMEELFYRGFLYPVLKRQFGVAAGILGTALPFGLMHFAQYGNSWASVLLIFVVGVVLAVVREWKNSLGASFLVHVAYNGTISMLMFAATDGFRHLEKLTQ
jgi:membrane protease YdiL (CAAX protease family)